MKCIDAEFETNANSTGKQQFRMICQGTMPNGKHAYLYQRTYCEGVNLGRPFGFEVFTPSVKKAGTYPLPGGKTITYAEDFEEYPGASKFGLSAWFYPTLETAQKRYDKLMANPVEAPETPEEVPTTPKAKGRPKAERPPLVLPDGEFSVTELGVKNGVDYPIAFNFVKEEEAAGRIKRTRTERRNAKGKETQLFQRI